jgi:uncharacterized spore protein YtfJ
VVVVPAVEVFWAGEFGTGIGFGEKPVRQDEDFGSGGGEGSGAGGRIFARSVAVINASEDGVHVERVIDPTKILLAALTAGNFMVVLALCMISPRWTLWERQAE